MKVVYTPFGTPEHHGAQRAPSQIRFVRIQSRPIRARQVDRPPGMAAPPRCMRAWPGANTGPGSRPSPTRVTSNSKLCRSSTLELTANGNTGLPGVNIFLPPTTPYCSYETRMTCQPTCIVASRQASWEPSAPSCASASNSRPSGTGGRGGSCLDP